MSVKTLSDRLKSGGPLFKAMADRFDEMITAVNALRDVVISGQNPHVASDTANAVSTLDDVVTLDRIIDMTLEECIDYAAHIASAVYHLAADTVNVLTETSVPSAVYALVNDLTAKYNAHRVLTTGNVHGAADSTNTVTATAVATKADTITRLNLLRTKYEAHRVLTTSNVHRVADAVNAIAVAALTSSATWTQMIALANDIRAKYEAHIKYVPFFELTTTVEGVDGVAEVSQVICLLNQPGTLNGKYFTLNSPTVGYYVWFTTGGVGVDPAVGGRTGIVIDLPMGTSTAAAVAAAIAAVLDVHEAFDCTADGAELTITNVAAGAATDVGAGDSEFAVSVSQQGADAVAEILTTTITSACTTNGDVGVVIRGATPVLIAVTTADDTAAKVATAVRAGTYPGWTPGGADATVTFTADAAGAKTGSNVINGGDTGVTLSAGIAVTTPGVDLVSAVAEVLTLTVTHACDTDGNVYISLRGGTPVAIAVTTSDDSATKVATTIRAGTFAGWVAGGAAADVTFTASVAEEKSGANTFYAGDTGVLVAAGITVTLAGVDTVVAEEEVLNLEITGGASGAGHLSIVLNGAAAVNVYLVAGDSTPTEVADHIRGTEFPGWVVTGSAEDVIFTADTAEARAGANSIDVGTTGVTTGGILTGNEGVDEVVAVNEILSLIVTHECIYSNNLTITLRGGTPVVVAVVDTDDTPTKVATAIRAETFAGWATGGTGTEVTFTATVAEAKVGDNTITYGATGVMANEIDITTPGVTLVSAVAEVLTITVATPCTFAGNASFVIRGAAAVTVAVALTDDTIAKVATKIRAGTYPGWTTGGADQIVTLTADVAEAKVGDNTFWNGDTGAGATGGITVVTLGADAIAEVSTVTPVVNTEELLDGKYFLLSSTIDDYYVWFSTDGVGVDPAVPIRTGANVDLPAGRSTAAEVAVATKAVLDGLGDWTTVQGTGGETSKLTITDDTEGASTNAGAGTSGFTVTTVTPGFDEEYEVTEVIPEANTSSCLNGLYFVINSHALSYYAWFSTDGVGTDPAVPGKTGINVDLAAGNSTAAQVAEKIKLALDDGIIFNATRADTVVTVTNVVVGSATNASLGPYVHGIEDATNELVEDAFDDETSQAVTDTVLNELKAVYNVHQAEFGTYHAIKDEAILVTAADATTFDTSRELAKDFKEKFNDHITRGDSYTEIASLDEAN